MHLIPERYLSFKPEECFKLTRVHNIQQKRVMLQQQDTWLSLELWWSLVEAEVLGSSARLWGDGWWRWMGGGGSGCDVLDRSSAAAELAGDEEEGPSPSIAGCGSTMGVAWGCLSGRRSSGPPFIAQRGCSRGGG